MNNDMEMNEDHSVSGFLSALMAPLATAVLALGLSLISIELLEDYGWSLFIGVPVFTGIFSATFYNFKTRRTGSATLGVGALSGVLLCGAFLILGLEGILCVVMALPLAVPLAVIGSCIGYLLCRLIKNPNVRSSSMLLMLVMLPIMMGFEKAYRGPTPTRKVVTEVIIQGDIQDVWDQVVGFSTITAEPRGVLAWGIAYPVDATIEGEGVGAVRYCNFTTGPFVEPITRWDEPTLLQFDVVENPMPMQEISFHDEIHAPHLHGFMVSERGQFRLENLTDGSVRLEGTTWYHHDLWPSWYWGPMSDYIIHQIHDRVLNHIAQQVEKL